MPENIHTPPTEGIRISCGVGGSVRPKKLKKCMKLNWNFQRGGEKNLSVGEVLIFSGKISHNLINCRRLLANCFSLPYTEKDNLT